VRTFRWRPRSRRSRPASKAPRTREQSRLRGCGARRLTVSVDRAGSARANGLDSCANRLNVAALDSSRTRASSSSRRAMIPPTRPAISCSWPAPDPPLSDLPPRASITPHPTISPQPPTGANSEPQTRQNPIESASLAVLHRRLAHHTVDTRHRQALLAIRPRQIRVAEIAQTDPGSLGPGANRSPAQASLGIDRRRHPPRPAITIGFSSRQRRQVLSPPGHRLQAFPSLCRVHAERERARTPRVQSDWDEATGPVA
jgi:hypothetical protein